MEFVKLLKDYSKSPLETSLNEYLEQKLTCVVCHEKIKNKEFMLQYVKPIHDFIITTTALPSANIRRVV